MKSMILIGFRIFKPYSYRTLFSVLILLFVLTTCQAQSLIPELSFKSPSLKKCKGCMGEGQDGAVYIFSNVGWGMDALVTISGRSQAEVLLSNIDIKGPEEDQDLGTGFDNAWQPGISYGEGKAPANQIWWMEFKISFVSHLDNASFIPVKQFFVSGLDIDGDGNQLHEFQVYYKMQSYSLDNKSAIFASSVTGSEADPFLKGKRFDGTIKNYPGISVSDENGTVRNFYNDCAFLIVRLGAVTGKAPSVQADRKYGLLFKSMIFGPPGMGRTPSNLMAKNEVSRNNNDRIANYG
jgi:hypothetical protein